MTHAHDGEEACRRATSGYTRKWAFPFGAIIRACIIRHSALRRDGKLVKGTVNWFVLVVVCGLVQVWIAVTVLLALTHRFHWSLILANSVLLFFSTALVASSIYALKSVKMWSETPKRFGLFIMVVLVGVAAICYGADLCRPFLRTSIPLPETIRLIFEAVMTLVSIAFAFYCDRVVSKVIMRAARRIR